MSDERYYAIMSFLAFIIYGQREWWGWIALALVYMALSIITDPLTQSFIQGLTT